MPRSARYLLPFVLVLVIVLIAVGYASAVEFRGADMTVSFLDVGQGDAIFIDAPSGRQVLIDGGPGSSVLRELARAMPWYDRSIDVVVATHPDADHIEGLIDVLARYDVGMIVSTSALGETALSQTLAQRSLEEGAVLVSAQRGERIDLGGGAQLEILFPDRPVPGLETNVGCVVTRLTYGATSFMLPCDAPDEIEEYLVRLDGERLRSQVLKAAHHGSKTSSSAVFVGAVAPEYAVFSRGCDNSYGHPSPETIATFDRFGVPMFDTCEEGTITFISDGQSVSRR